jgi:hypothetical protein
VDIVLTSTGAGVSGTTAGSTDETAVAGGSTMGSVTASAGCAGVTVDSAGSAAGVVDAGSFVDDSGVGSVGGDVVSSDVPCVEVCAPPELLTDVGGLSSDPDGVSAFGVESGAPEGVVDVVEVSAAESVFVPVSGPDEGPAEAPSAVSADATPWPVATARPRKVATANPLARRLDLDEATLLLLSPPRT